MSGALCRELYVRIPPPPISIIFVLKPTADATVPVARRKQGNAPTRQETSTGQGPRGRCRDLGVAGSRGDLATNL